MTRHSVNNNTRKGLAISVCSNSDHLISLISPKLSQILDIYSNVALQELALGFINELRAIKIKREQIQ